MSLKIEYIGGFNPFEWEAMRCPVCKRNNFISKSHGAIFCQSCFAQFSVRSTAGDPGCVVDCFINLLPLGGSILAPMWQCKDCGEKTSFFKWQKPTCPQNVYHTMEPVDGIFKHWQLPPGYPEGFYLILKLGDYCSGWLKVPGTDSVGFPKQKEWDQFQKEKCLV